MVIFIDFKLGGSVVLTHKGKITPKKSHWTILNEMEIVQMVDRLNC